MSEDPVRPDGRGADQLRPVDVTLDHVEYPRGSVLVAFGRTRVLCNASVTEGVPAWMAEDGTGCLTAEYALLSGSTHPRTPRELTGLSGRARTAAVTGGYVAVALALRRLVERGLVSPEVTGPPVAAVSVGVVAGDVRLDLRYAKDREADVDLNVAMLEDGRFVEVQGTAEGDPFSRETLAQMLGLASKGIVQLIRYQREVLA